MCAPLVAASNDSCLIQYTVKALCVYGLLIAGALLISIKVLAQEITADYYLDSEIVGKMTVQWETSDPSLLVSLIPNQPGTNQFRPLQSKHFRFWSNKQLKKATPKANFFNVHAAITAYPSHYQPMKHITEGNIYKAKNLLHTLKQESVMLTFYQPNRGTTHNDGNITFCLSRCTGGRTQHLLILNSLAPPKSPGMLSSCYGTATVSADGTILDENLFTSFFSGEAFFYQLGNETLENLAYALNNYEWPLEVSSDECESIDLTDRRKPINPVVLKVIGTFHSPETSNNQDTIHVYGNRTPVIALSRKQQSLAEENNRLPAIWLSPPKSWKTSAH